MRSCESGDIHIKTNEGLLKGLGAVAALLMFGGAAAQDTKKAPAAPKAAAKTPSACKGLVEAACKAKATECTWIAEVKTKAGTTRRAHCRSKPGKKK